MAPACLRDSRGKNEDVNEILCPAGSETLPNYKKFFPRMQDKN